MSKTLANPNRAANSTPTAQPAASQAAPGPGAQPGIAEPDFELPSAAEIAAELKNDSDLAPADPTAEVDDDAETESDTVASEAPADETGDAPETATDESGEPAADDDAAPAPGDSEEETEDAAPEAAPKHGRDQRINDLRRRVTTAEEEAGALREQLAAAKSKPIDPLNPFALVDTPADLEAVITREEAFLDWTLLNEANPDGADLPDGKGGVVHFEPEQIRQMKVNTTRVLRTADKRREFLREKAQRDAEAVTVYPWLRTTKEGYGAEVQRMIEARPHLRASSDYRLIAADAIVGAKLRAAGVKLDDKGMAALLKGRPLAPAAKPTGPAGALSLATSRSLAAPVRRTAPSPARPGNLPPRLTGREAQVRATARSLASGDGSMDVVSNSIAAKMRF